MTNHIQFHTKIKLTIIIENVLKESTCDRTFTWNRVWKYIKWDHDKAWYHVIRSCISLKNITDKKCDGTHWDNIKDDFIEITTLLIDTHQGI